MSSEGLERRDDPAPSAAARWWESGEVDELWCGVFKGGGAKGVAYAGALAAVAKERRWFSAVAGS